MSGSETGSTVRRLGLGCVNRLWSQRNTLFKIGQGREERKKETSYLLLFLFSSSRIKPTGGDDLKGASKNPNTGKRRRGLCATLSFCALLEFPSFL